MSLVSGRTLRLSFLSNISSTTDRRERKYSSSATACSLQISHKELVAKVSQAAKERMAVRKVLPTSVPTEVKEEPGEVV
jgi:hypothetical protein